MARPHSSMCSASVLTYLHSNSLCNFSQLFIAILQIILKNIITLHHLLLPLSEGKKGCVDTFLLYVILQDLTKSESSAFVKSKFSYTVNTKAKHFNVLIFNYIHYVSLKDRFLVQQRKEVKNLFSY